MSHKEETNIQNLIRVELSKKNCLVFRINVGNFYTKYGQEIKIGVVGHSDLYGVRPDGKAFFVECKTQTGNKRKMQEKFIKVVKSKNALAGFARSVEDAMKIAEKEHNKTKEIRKGKYVYLWTIRPQVRTLSLGPKLP